FCWKEWDWKNYTFLGVSGGLLFLTFYFWWVILIPVMFYLGAQGAPGRPQRKSGDRVVFRAAEKSVEFFDHLCAHYRETRRTSVEIPCDVRLLLHDGTLFDTGSATVRNVSPSGALITGLKLEKDCLPARGFRVVLTLRGDDYKGIGIEATPVRLIAESGGLGLRFEEIFVTV
ncbi:MAG: hypothetical protein NTW87_25720, partial [Planctomycetota bacterium]|nr:hypothetical protein [Planctomycetota bacterium]